MGGKGSGKLITLSFVSVFLSEIPLHFYVHPSPRVIVFVVVIHVKHTMPKACPVCGSRKWRKDGVTGNAICEDGHVFQASQTALGNGSS